MQKDKKFFSLNKIKDFKKCDMKNITLSASGCRLTDPQTSSKGTILIKPMNAYEKGMVWDRLRIDAIMPKGAKITGHLLATEDADLYASVRNPVLTLEEKIDLIAEQDPVLISNPQDALLHTLKGQYLMGWFIVYSPESTPIIERIRFYYPKQSLLDYLPELYQNADETEFLHRYLSIFRSVLMDLEEEVDTSPKHLMSRLGSQEDIWWLAQTLGLENPEIWSEDDLRARVAKAVELSNLRGTRKGIKEISQFITNLDCFIIEQHDLGRKKADSYLNQLYDKLYGLHPSDFTILVPNDGLSTERTYNQMKKALDSVKPAYTSARLVSLQPYLRLDQHAYLGINSSINKPGTLVLDNRSALPYNTVLTDRAERKMQSEE